MSARAPIQLRQVGSLFEDFIHLEWTTVNAGIESAYSISIDVCNHIDYKDYFSYSILNDLKNRPIAPDQWLWPYQFGPLVWLAGGSVPLVTASRWLACR